MLARVDHYLRHLGLRDLISKDPADPFTTCVDFKHDACSVLTVQPEDLLQDIDDELHRRIVVVQQDHLVEGWPFQAGGGLLEYQSSFVPRALFAHGLISCFIATLYRGVCRAIQGTKDSLLKGLAATGRVACRVTDRGVCKQRQVARPPTCHSYTCRNDESE